jgi:Fe-S cluster assembly protein SufD
LPLAEAWESHGDLIRDHLMRHPVPTGSHKFAQLHLASLRNGTFLYIPKGVHVAQPLHVGHWLAGAAQSAFPHTLVIAEEDSSATLVDWYASADSTRHMACSLSDLWLMRGASVRYLSVQQWNRSTASVHACSTHVNEGASALTLGLHLGGSYSRFEHVSRLLGRGARSEMYGLTVADEKQHFDQRTLQEHASADTYSNLLFKNALYDSAKTTFSGLIRVDEHAHRTDAYQKVRNLLLSDQAEANSLPGLEILADQVRCSHGATTGEIDAEELFYLRSRGIPEKTAFGLITEGFLSEVLQKIEDAPLQDLCAGLVRARLGGH